MWVCGEVVHATILFGVAERADEDKLMVYLCHLPSSW